MREPHGATDQSIIRSGRERIDPSRWQQTFAGRRSLVERLQGTLSVEPPAILAISGLGGIGKSYVLHNLRADVNAAAAMCPVAWVNFQAGESDTHAAPALWSVRQQLRATGAIRTIRFDILYTEWFRRSAGHGLERSLLLGEDLRQVLDALGRLEDAPLLGWVARSANWVTDLGVRGVAHTQERRVVGWFHALPEVDEYAEWPRALTEMSMGSIELVMPRALAADITDAGPALRPSYEPGRGDRCLIVIDTYERVADTQGREELELVPTFVEDLCAELVRSSAPAVVIVSGRDPTYWGWRRASDGWAPDPQSAWGVPEDATDPGVYVAGRFEAIRLDAFSVEEMTEYLVERRHLSAACVEVVHRVTGGYVLAAAIAADLLAASDPSDQDALGDLDAPDERAGWTQEAVERRAGDLLHRLLEQLARQGRRDLEALLRAAAVPRVFDEDLLFAMTGAGAELVEALTYYSFVVAGRLQPGHHAVHPVVRDLLLRQGRRSPAQRRWHEAAKARFAQRAAEADNDNDRFAAEVEALYHGAATEGIAGLLELDDLFEAVLSRYAPDRCRRMLDAVADLPLEDDDSRALAALMRARLARALSDYEVMLAEISEAEKRIQGRDSHLALRILRESSTAHRLAGRHTTAVDRLERYDTSTVVGESRLMQGLSARNWALVYKDTDRIGEAIEQNGRARELLGRLGTGDDADLRAMGITNIQSVLISIDRMQGRLQYLMGNYVAAIDDFERVLDLSTESHVIQYTQLLIGHVLRQEGRFDSAAEIAHEAIEQFEHDGEARGVSTAHILLAETLCAAGRRDDAAALFEQLCGLGADVNPYAPVYGDLGLGEIARLRGDTNEALERYASVIDAGAMLGFRMEIAYALLGRSLVLGRRDLSSVGLDALEAVAIGRACHAPWIEVYGHLCHAVADIDAEDAALRDAIDCLDRFRRRPSDPDHDRQTVGRMADALGSGYAADIPLRIP